MNEALPTGWIRTPIGEVTTRAKQRQPLPQEHFDYIDIASIDRNTKQIRDPKHLSGVDAPSRARQVVAAGDVLVSMTRPNLNAVAMVTAEFDGQIASTGFDVLRPAEIDSRWLFYLVRSEEFVARMSELVQGALYPAIRPRDVRGFEIPLAPLPEQKRIADKLDALLARVGACCVRLERVPLILKRFRQAVLAAATSGRLTEDWREEIRNSRSSSTSAEEYQEFAFEDAACFGTYRFPSCWRITRLRDIADVDGGITKDTKKQSSFDEEVPYLRVANVQRGFLDLSEVKTMRVPSLRIEDLLLKPGDILFTEGGDLDKLGRGWVWSGEIPRCTFQNHVFRARLHDASFEPRFFSWYGNSRGFDYFVQSGKQTTNLASINKTLLSALPVVVPPLDEQTEIVCRVGSLFAFADRLEARYRAASSHVERLTPSLLAKAFRGELVPQDPADEPAAVLLERIRAARAAQRAKPKSVFTPRTPEMSKMTVDSVRDTIRQLTVDTFSFEELRKRLPGDYDSLKEIVFALLDESDPSITQAFDQDAKVMCFVRRRT